MIRELFWSVDADWILQIPMAPQGTEDFVACHYTKTGIFLYDLLIIWSGIIILEESKSNRRSRRVQCTCVEKTLEIGYPCKD
jgi:hypothetical protein